MQSCNERFESYMTLNYDIPGIRQHMYNGSFGLERETLRVDANGALAQTAHPFGDVPNISRDFCENQVEIITDVANSARSAVNQLKNFHVFTAKRLLGLDSGKEYIWPFSNPPRISGEDEIPIAEFSGDLRQKSAYRQYLSRKYGKKKMLFSGIHCNYSFSDELIFESFRDSGFESIQSYKDSLYLSLAKRLTKYSWLLVYLTAASPVCDDSFVSYADVGSKYASARCSEIGYWNNFVPVLSYDSIFEYAKSIQNYIDNQNLISISELYYPIRLKPKGENSVENLVLGGVNHIELRMLDVNPLTSVGIFEQDVDFVQLLILYLMSLSCDEFGESEQAAAVQNMKNSAEFNDNEIFIIDQNGKKNIKIAAIEILNEMSEFFSSLSAPNEVFGLIEYQLSKLRLPKNRYADIVRELFEQDYTAKGLELAKRYADEIK